MKVSICIPTYNSPETLKRLMDSVFCQSFTDYEVVVSDDSSNDEVEKVVKSYSDNRVSFYHNEKPLGTPENWNNAVRKSRGEFVKIMHHDDWFVNKDALQVMVDTMEKQGTDFVFCQCVGSGANHPSEEAVKSHKEVLPRLLVFNVIGAPSVTMYKKTGLMFDSKIKYYVDVDFYIAYLSTHKCFYIPQELVGIGTTPVRVTDQVVEDRSFVYGEFQYAFLKLWNDERWSKKDLSEVFRDYVKTNVDFGNYGVKGLVLAQRFVLARQRIRDYIRNTKRKLKGVGR